jgi:hypothetical protein
LGVSDKHICEMADDDSLPAFHVGRPIRMVLKTMPGWLQKKKLPMPQQIRQNQTSTKA